MENDQQPMSLQAAFIHYAICFIIFGVTMSLSKMIFSTSISMIVSLIVYLGLGIYLSRAVLANLIEWHPVYSTLQNVASSKLKMLLLWPIQYLSLFFKLGVNKVL